jgi:hypothetical protein
MKDELVIQSLVELYKERGIDLHLLLDDPMFTHLPLESKVNSIKQYASHIASPTSRTLTRADVKSVLTNSLAGAGLAGGSVLMRRYLTNKANGVDLPISIRGMAIAAGLGAAGGAIKTIFDRSKSIAQRNDMNKAFNGLVQSGEDKDAIKIMALRNLQNVKSGPPGIVGAFLGNTVDSVLPMAIDRGNAYNNAYVAMNTANEYGAASDRWEASQTVEEMKARRTAMDEADRRSQLAIAVSGQDHNRFLGKIQENFKGLL